ncbi:glutathione S-transferase [Duganella sp. BJB488]|uniref:glutathione S-transferase family protein n=1 Tax=unclassified Duganella TaxID=2636909 RepID=UPI000E340C7A|nr:MULTISPECIES: glutathione S-transferase [unclassified Duganella]NVD72937.1 glutathione S-transferase [Duganella sp. BJB1802]RFP11764.1 glutathione S-transferase [Duganella sp. BJB489]RFP15525.1 glutathione S-transferase [Duganella sp. BJB488]RFP30471.1 glutathione S-transferase [Duganella sp. BJB480]
MKLIGMLDSPYVRRVAVTLQLMGVRFEHQSLSVFSTFDQFRQINPVVKAPTFLADDGTVLMDSTLIVQYAEALAMPSSRLTPSMPTELLRSLRVLGLALAACDKGVQLVYEGMVRPTAHQPWAERVTVQLLAAFDALEAELRAHPLSVAALDHAGVMTAVTWHFMQQMLPQVVDASRYPLQAEFSRQAEALPAFRAAPHGDSTYVA